MRSLVFAQAVNATGRHDATGAFIPGARAFVRTHNLDAPILLQDHNDRGVIFDAIEDAHDLDVIAYFGHGTRASLPSADIHWRDIASLAPLIYRAAKPDCQVILYACSTGEVGCFANQLSKLMNFELTVWGHTCVGHSFTNPYVTYFPYLSSAFLIDPHGPLWRKWHRLIKSGSNIWARFPFMSQAELEEEVAASP